jgi:peptide chain release factor 2
MELEAQISHKDFWNNPDATAPVLKERTQLTNAVDNWKALTNLLEDTEILYELATEEGDNSALKDVESQIRQIDKRLSRLSIEMMFDSEEDGCNAIVSINAGAGGTDSQDWAEMLFRMYSRWCDQKGYKETVIDHQPGDEAGIKSVTFSVTGENAYGYLKVESGVHRLVRISPFNANGKRQTSFSSVFVFPELNDEIVVDVEEKDIRIDVFRASGSGGQHVNKTSSAVRITHFPTGIVVQCQQESSQHRNRDIAMKLLKSRLYQFEKQKRDEKLQAIHDGKDEINFGSQIRSYILHPYQMVKDHRTGYETGNVKAVLDGDLDPAIESSLLSGMSQDKKDIQ